MPVEETTAPDTPMMRQYLEIKRRYRNEILFFRMGDFYEMFLEDAVTASKILDIALTKRQDAVPMCGVPYHAMHNYVLPLLKSGRNIAICEQVEDPRSVSGRIVKRDVTRILTPGTVFEEQLLPAGERRTIAAVSRADEKSVIATADLSTGELWLEYTETEYINGFFTARDVKEVICAEESDEPETVLPVTLHRVKELQNENERILKAALKTENLEPFELNEDEKAVLALLFSYISTVAPRSGIHWQSPVREYRRQSMIIDEAALKTLEILRDQNNERSASLAGVLDRTLTAAGRRRLHERLSRPSADSEQIAAYHDTVEYLFRARSLRSELSELLSECADIERLLVSLSNGPQVRHLGRITETLNAAEKITGLFRERNDLPSELARWQQPECFSAELHEELNRALHLEELPPVLDERRFVRSGYSATLDEFIELSESAHEILKQFEQSERKKHDIPTLKIKYNRVIGYFIEISKGAAEKAPAEYVRRQTLVNAERFTSEELKDLETRILNSKEEVIALQRGIFEQLRETVISHEDSLRKMAGMLSDLDVHLSFSECASRCRYIRPEMTEGSELILKESRHPVVEEIFREEMFVPNDIHLNNSDRHLAILTGPNMSGKSTFIRQIGLVQVMAQAGCFVPAAAAVIPVADRVFTRIGAYDRLFKGESTFFVEMLECARIFRNFTERSLILLDEVGRGTSTYDGISIARAMIEYLNRPESGRPKTLFATHYGELSELVSEEKGIVGLTVQVLEEKDRIVFLRRIAEGSADKSYGIYVADLAGLPAEIIDRAGELLNELETAGLWSKSAVQKEGETVKNRKAGPINSRPAESQLDMFN